MKPESLLHSSDQAEIVARYSKRIAEYGPTASALNVGKPDYYARQHEVHCQLMSTDVGSVIDIGCGIGSFYRFLRHRARRISYLGIDIVPEFVKAASDALPEAKFVCRDIFKEGLPEAADHIVMCQVFNSRFKLSNNAEVIREALRIGFGGANISVSIDMLSKYVNYEEESLFYADPEQMFAYAKTLTPYVALKHDYLPHHFTLALYKR
jgi:SAM-dependent methyltransferase